MDGILIINKPKDYTSHDVVAKVKKIVNEKVGHTGTLDPNATGVLPLLIGKGTLISKYLINHDKIYKATIKLGVKTETADVEGKVVETRDVDSKILKNDMINNALNQFLGDVVQYPPIYSAIKVKGKKLYEYAREGKDVKIEPRNIHIYNINLDEIDKENQEIVFTVKCSKGTYIRSLCEDIAEKLGTIGYMKELNRIEVGEFNIDESISIEDLIEHKDDKEYIKNKIYSIEELFDKNQEIDLEQKQYPLYLNGVKQTFNKPDGVYRIYTYDNNFIGLGIVKDKLLKRDVVLDIK